jgi:two-component system chemotaxis response regulator CheY
MVIDKHERKTRILVVDDHALTREMVCSILRSVGFSQIETAENGQNALSKLRDRHFDAVVCDWNMPTMTGIEFLRAVRQEEDYKYTPFLMLTAEAYKENIVEAMQAGVSDYVVKPFTASILEEKLVRLVD